MIQSVASTAPAGAASSFLDLHAQAYRWMLLARVLDDKFAGLYRAGKIHGIAVTGLQRSSANRSWIPSAITLARCSARCVVAMATSTGVGPAKVSCP